MSERVTIDIQDHIAHVKLNRPDKMNALDDAMFEGIIATGERLKTDKDVRAVVLSGEGRAFCAGLDMANFANMADAGDGSDAESTQDESKEPFTLERRVHGLTNRPQHASWVWREVPVPVIAALHGVAYGGGTQIAVGADMRYATADCKFCIMEMRWGLVPDMGATPFLQRLLGDDVLRELTYTNRVFLADEAQALGLVTRVCEDPVAAALETAGEIAQRNPDAIRGAKRILNNAPFQSAGDILLSESREQDKIIGKPNQVEAVMSNLEQRPPQYGSAS